MQNIFFYTGNRAEFSLLKPLINSIKSIRGIKIKLIVSGAHLDNDYGKTFDEIEKANLGVEILKGRLKKLDSYYSTSEFIADSINVTSNILKNYEPSFLVIYGDRSEALGACIAGSQNGFPIIHIEGGDITEGGCLDDNVRHCMTKLSHIHCTTNEKSTKNVLTLGEESWRIKNIGLPSLDEIYQAKHASKNEIEKKFNLNLKLPIIIFTQHTVSSELSYLKKDIEESVMALEKLCKNFSCQIICTYPNNDKGAGIIIERLKKLEKEFDLISLHKSLGGFYYHGLLALAKEKDINLISIGNSSSGIKETACFNCNHINIGTRQNGRNAPVNISNVSYDAEDIYKKGVELISNNKINKINDPYWNNGAGNNFRKLLQDLLTRQINDILVKKTRGTSLEQNK